jgi:E3 ubiquitin-protein ligase BRE1
MRAEVSFLRILPRGIEPLTSRCLSCDGSLDPTGRAPPQKHHGSSFISISPVLKIPPPFSFLREIRDLHDRLASERGSSARAQQYSRSRAQQLAAEIDTLGERAREAHHERDRLLGRIHELQYQADQGAHAARILAAAETRAAEADAHAHRLRVERDEAQQRARQEAGARSSSATVAELQEALTARECDLKVSKEAADKYRAEASGATAARSQASEARIELDAVQARLRLSNQRLDEARAKLAMHDSERLAWQVREADLRMFTEIGTAFAGERRDAVAVRLREEFAELRSRVEELSCSNGAGGLVQELREREAALLREVGALEGDKVDLGARVQGLQAQVGELEGQCNALKEDSELIMQQLEALGQAHEDSQAQNSRLLAALASRDADNARLLEDAVRAGQERAAMVEAGASASIAVHHAEEAAAAAMARVADLEARCQALLLELSAARDEARAAAVKAEAAGRDLREAEARLLGQTAELEASRAEVARRAAERNEEATRGQHEKTRADRAQAAMEEMQSRMDRLKRMGLSGEGGGEAQAELDVLRRMINCSVCHVRQKDVIITKCSHLFCSTCLQNNLQSRHRKCPGCGLKFGENDVKSFYFT